MNVYEGLEAFPKLQYPVVTSGTFDGVHKGHQQILNRLKEVAEKNGGESVVLTFWPHPRMVLNPGDEVKLLSTIEEKQELLEAEGIQYMVILPFTREFSKLSSEEFVQKVLVNGIGTKKLVIGYDHKFGRNREGSFESLKANGPHYGFDVEEIPRQDVDHTAVSSTRIREALYEGSVKTASEYLGRPYSLQGKVVEGDKLGRTIGYPTANVEVPENYKLIPSRGVYAVRVLIGSRLFSGMLSIGVRPTVNGDHETIEVNIFEFNEDIYNRFIRIYFVHYIRPEEKYENLERMKEQLARDKEDTLTYLQNEGIIT